MVVSSSWLPSLYLVAAVPGQVLAAPLLPSVVGAVVAAALPLPANRTRFYEEPTEAANEAAN